MGTKNSRYTVSGSCADTSSPKRIREKFLIIYELKGSQKAVNFLADYYKVKKMHVILNGRKVGNGYLACYIAHRAYFTKKGLNKKTVLHEFYHHLVEVKDIKISLRTEERKANIYSKKFFLSNS